MAEGSREDRESWRQFLRYLRERGLERIALLVSDKSLGLWKRLVSFTPRRPGSDAWCIFSTLSQVLSRRPVKNAKIKKSKSGGMETSDIKRMRELEYENSRVEQMELFLFWGFGRIVAYIVTLPAIAVGNYFGYKLWSFKTF